MTRQDTTMKQDEAKDRTTTKQGKTVNNKTRHNKNNPNGIERQGRAGQSHETKKTTQTKQNKRKHARPVERVASAKRGVVTPMAARCVSSLQNKR